MVTPIIMIIEPLIDEVGLLNTNPEKNTILPIDNTMDPKLNPRFLIIVLTTFLIFLIPFLIIHYHYKLCQVVC